MYVYVYVYIFCIYIYMEREREREREKVDIFGRYDKIMNTNVILDIKHSKRIQFSIFPSWFTEKELFSTEKKNFFWSLAERDNR